MADEVLLVALKVHSATHLPKVDWIGHIDPYVIAYCGGETARTKVLSNNRYPAWEETLLLKVPLKDGEAPPAVLLQLWDEDRLSPNDLVAQVGVRTSSFETKTLEMKLEGGVKPWKNKVPELLISMGCLPDFSSLCKRLHGRPGLLIQEDYRQLSIPLLELGPGVHFAITYSEDAASVDVALFKTADVPSGTFFDFVWSHREGISVWRRSSNTIFSIGGHAVRWACGVKGIPISEGLERLTIEVIDAEIEESLTLAEIAADPAWDPTPDPTSGMRYLLGNSYLFEKAKKGAEQPPRAWLYDILENRRYRYLSFVGEGIEIQEVFETEAEPKMIGDLQVMGQLRLEQTPEDLHRCSVQVFRRRQTQRRAISELLPF